MDKQTAINLANEFLMLIEKQGKQERDYHLLLGIIYLLNKEGYLYDASRNVWY